MSVGLLGFVLGFVGSVPLTGPIAALVFARSLDGRVRAAIATGLGAAVAEGGYAFLAYAGYQQFLADHPAIVSIARVVAAILLVATAVVIARQRPAPESDDAVADTKSGLTVGFAISALNPTLILSWTAILGVIGTTSLVALPAGYGLAFAVGVAAGIACWFSLAARWIGRRRTRFSTRAVVRINRAMAVLLVGLAVALVVS